MQGASVPRITLWPNRYVVHAQGYSGLCTPPYTHLGVFYNAKTCHFIVTYIDNCLFIGPNIGYKTDLKKRLNKVYAIEDLGPAAYFLGYLNSTKDYSICFSYNGNIVADLGPKLSNSSNTTTKLSRDFHSKEGPRPLTTTSTTIVDSRNGKGSSRTSIINSSLVPIGFSNSDFTGDKATSKSTYSYLHKLAEAIREVQTKHTLLKFRYVREQVKAKIVTIIYLNTKYMPADGLTKALPVLIPVTAQHMSLSLWGMGRALRHLYDSYKWPDLGQSSRPLPPIQTLLEDKKDSEDYSKVIEVLKHLNTLKASVEDSVSAIKNISSTLASLTDNSNAIATTTGKTSYKPYLGLAIDNTATSNLDPPLDIGSKEGFKDTITSSLVKELSKQAYTIPDDSKLSGESNFEHDSNQTVLLMLLRNSLSSSPRAAISRPIESKKKDVYNEFHALTFSTYKKGLSAFNAEFNSYLAKLTTAKIDIDPPLILNQYFKAL
ncbi:hypothetical protein P8C59_004288 [Phyllachora maydis]|uniref:Uncharacterized protein n=1 Tax=Phyllachora maydis TaxID=1825666 RepID=A0AAD9MA91_9PEZI|nr:hypothetical protein P8C59_004288 [Phyllachora maydis]